MADDNPFSVEDDAATADMYAFMVDNLDADAIEAVAFDIGIDPGDLDGDLVDELTRSLIHTMAQRNEMQLLDLALRNLYPVQYAEAFREALYDDAQLADSEPPELDGVVHPRSGVTLAHVPAGPFIFGDDLNDSIELPDFAIGLAPVTNVQYKQFLDANPDYPVPAHDDPEARPFNWDPDARLFPPGRAHHPVVLVSWDDAQAYCRWAGLRLPTEEEWEKAARGVDGRRYPWGDDDATEDKANYGRHAGNRFQRGTTQVGVYSPNGDSPYGAVDMAGNVWEWTATAYEADGGPRGQYVLRGGAWDSEELELESTFQLGRERTYRAPNLGFRVAE